MLVIKIKVNIFLKIFLVDVIFLELPFYCDALKLKPCFKL